MIFPNHFHKTEKSVFFDLENKVNMGNIQEISAIRLNKKSFKNPFSVKSCGINVEFGGKQNVGGRGSCRIRDRVRSYGICLR